MSLWWCGVGGPVVDNNQVTTNKQRASAKGGKIYRSVTKVNNVKMGVGGIGRRVESGECMRRGRGAKNSLPLKATPAIYSLDITTVILLSCYLFLDNVFSCRLFGADLSK